MNHTRIRRNVDNIVLRNNELWDAAKIRDFDAVYRLTFETLNWIINSNDWFFKNYPEYKKELSKTKDSSLILLGLRHAYNSFKHDMDILSLEEKNYDFQLKLGHDVIPIERIVWLSSIELKYEKNWEQLFNAYREYIEGKSVLETLKEAQIILSKVYSIFNKSLSY